MTQPKTARSATKSAADPKRRTPGPVGGTVYINARLLDPASGLDTPGGVLVRDGLIADIGPHLRRNAPADTEVIDCKGNLLAPGLVDCQVFTGEPGQEHRETLKTASYSAAAGGVTTIVVMPDTQPVIDQVALVDFIQRRARDNALVHVATMAAMTRNLEGGEITEFGLLQRAGAVAFTNGKTSITDTRVMRNALLYAKDFDALIVHHTEDPYLSKTASMNSGEVSARLGLPGVNKVAETITLERDIRLLEVTGGRYHAATITCRESLDVIRAAKSRGLRVTCGVSINHLTLNELDIGSYRTYFKVRPPLRREDDRLAMVEGVADGTIDVIVSSHDPQDADVKRRPFAEAADGAVGLETLLSAALRLHYGNEEVPLLTLWKALSTNPAHLLGLKGGNLAKGEPADLIIVDLGEPWVVNKELLRSRSKNTPFDDSKMQGRVLRTVVAGETVFPFSPG
ncbi:MAG: dihydroorotase [Hyphomicrobiaceae bacterium]